jgi:hypothetical protein
MRAAALLCPALAAACRPPDPPAPPPSGADPAADAVETCEVQLDDDFITVRLHIPPTAEPRKPSVILTSGNRAALLCQGFLAVTYRINWDVHKLPAPPPPSEHSVGKWMPDESVKIHEDRRTGPVRSATDDVRTTVTAARYLATFSAPCVRQTQNVAEPK